MISSDLCVYACLSPNIEKLDSELFKQADAFAKRLNLPIFHGPAVEPKKLLPESLSDFAYVLYYHEGGMSILQLGKGAPGPVDASFQGGKTGHRLKFGGGKGQMIAKAVGLNKGVIPSIVDATAGLGRDAFVLASLGCHVTMLERSPIVAELLKSALNEDLNSSSIESQESEMLKEIISRMTLIESDSTLWLNSQAESVADVIYLDPMYPHRDKSSLVKKEMRLFQSIVGEDLDDKSLLEAALKKARYRVVVKRPRKGEAIEGKKPSLQIVGKSCRYDIYTLRRIEDLANG